MQAIISTFKIYFFVPSFLSGDDSADAVTFLYQLVSGSAGKSYGLNVARLASIPEDILCKAAMKSQELQKILQKKRYE